MAVFETETLRYQSEKGATKELLKLLSDDFEVWQQVEMGSSDQDLKGNFRIDLVARMKKEPDVLVGFELKKGFRRPHEYVKAFKQAHDYRDSVCTDGEQPAILNKRLAAIFIFPNWQGNADEKTTYTGHAAGIEMLAGTFRVGSAGIHKFRGLTLFMGQNRLWSQAEGFRKDWQDILFGKRQIGSTRKMDRD